MKKSTVTSKNPLVSVILPVYNREDLVIPAIESILDQTYKNLELVLVDDGSTDKTSEILAAYKARFPEKITLVTRSKPGGPGGYVASNAGLKVARGEFINRMDSDDISHPDRIRQEVEFLQNHPDYIMVGTFAYYINAANEILGVKKFPTDSQTIYHDFAVANPLMHPATLIRRSMLPNPNKLYKPRFGINDDYAMLFSLLPYGKAGNIDVPLYFYRVHDTNGSLQNFKRLFLDTAKIRVAAMLNFGYRPSFKAYVVFGGQLLMSLILPERFLRYLYFTLRGAQFPSTRLSKLGTKLSSIKFDGDRINVPAFAL